MDSRKLSDLWLSEFINLAQKVCPALPLLIYEARQESQNERSNGVMKIIKMQIIIRGIENDSQFKNSC